MSVIIENLILSSISEIRNNGEMDRKTSLHINAAEEVNTNLHIHGMVHIDLNWYDAPLQDINENGLLFHMIKLIDGYLRCGKQVLVNCFAGVSRSATIVIAYLMYKNKWNVQDAITFVRSKRPIINPNYGFVAQLYQLQDKLHTLDENFNQYTCNFQNKSHAELVKEVVELSETPLIKNVIQRELQGFNMPTTASFPPTNTSHFSHSNPYVCINTQTTNPNYLPNISTYYD